MALLLITGVPGTGKTLFTIQKYIIPELKKGGLVYTNIDGIISSRLSILFDLDIFIIQENLRIIKDAQFFYKELEKNSLCVLDESQNLFSNRDWNNKANTECVKYLMEHRHHGHKLVFITPHIDSLDAGIRRVAEFTYKHKSFSSLGSSKTVKCGIFDQANVQNTPLQIFTWRHDVRIYSCYKSYFDQDTKEEKVKVHPLRNAKLISILVFSLVMGFVGIKNSMKFNSKLRSKSGSEKIENKKNESQKVIISENRDYIIINDSLVSGTGKYKRVVK